MIAVVDLWATCFDCEGRFKVFKDDRYCPECRTKPRHRFRAHYTAKAMVVRTWTERYPSYLHPSASIPPKPEKVTAEEKMEIMAARRLALAERFGIAFSPDTKPIRLRIGNTPRGRA